MISEARSLSLLLVAAIATHVAIHSVFARPPDTAETEQKLENLETLSQLYGYVRFFHPSDQAASVDWDRFAILASRSACAAENESELMAVFNELFLPIAPSLSLSISGEAIAQRETHAPSPQYPRCTYWQHFGVQLAEDREPYRSVRIIPKSKGDRKALFAVEELPPPIARTLGNDIRLWLPSTLAIDQQDRTLPLSDSSWQALQKELSKIEIATLGPATQEFRVAGIIGAWNVFQHFHPYLDEIPTDWNLVLRSALQRTLADASGEDYYATLSEMVAGLGDGHGYVFGPPSGKQGLGIRVSLIAEKLVVTAVEENTPFQPGDVLLKIDDTAAADVLKERIRYISGSPHLRQLRALNQFGEGPAGSVAKVEIERNCQTLSVQASRRDDSSGFFHSRIPERDFPTIEEVRPGVFYINLMETSLQEYESRIPELAKAKAVIFDLRWDGQSTSDADPEAKRLLPAEHVIPHLIKREVRTSPMLVPQVTQPDRANWTFKESGWSVTPKAPFFSGKTIFINVPSVVSYGETCMAMIDAYELSTLVGEPTAGCNGDINVIPLPGGYRINWTGIQVLRHDRSSFYGVGFEPDIPVARSREAVIAGRDEFLEAAIAIATAEQTERDKR